MRSAEEPGQLRIAVLAETHTRGGAERQGYLMAQELHNMGHHVTVLSIFPPPFTSTRHKGLSAEFSDLPTDHALPALAHLPRWAYSKIRRLSKRKVQSTPDGTQPTSSQAESKKPQPGPLPRFLAKVLLGRDQSNIAGLLSGLMHFHLPSGIEVRFLMRLLRRSRCDLLISFLPKHNTIGILASLGIGIPVIISERNDYVHQPVSQSAQWARSVLYPHADIITANTEFAVNQLKEAFPGKKVLWLPNRLSFPTDVSADKRTTDDIYVISRLEPQKRIGSIIEALPLLHKMGLYPRILIFGEGSEEENLQALVTSKALDAHVTFNGYVPSHEIWGKVRHGGIFVTNSSYEGSSNSLHEAVAAGLFPIVSDTVEEVFSIVRPDTAKHIVFDGSPEGIAKTLDEVLRNKEARSEIFGDLAEDFQRYRNWSEENRNQAIGAFLKIIGKCRD